MKVYVIKSPFGYIRLIDDNIFYYCDIDRATPFSEEIGEYVLHFFKKRVCDSCELVKIE